MTHRMAQYQLSRVIAAGPDGRPREQRRKLILVEAVQLSTAARKTTHIQVIKSAGFITPVGSPHLRVDILRRAHTVASRVGKKIFEIWNLGHMRIRVALIYIRELRENRARCEIVHA